MKRTTHKLLSLLLTVVMVLALLPGGLVAPITALAATTDTVASWTELVTKYDQNNDKTITIPTDTVVTVTGRLEVPTGGVEYTLTGGGTLRHGNGNFSDMFFVTDDSKLTLADLTLDNAGISGSTSVYIHGGEFCMTGGRITGNTGGSGVLLGWGEFTMSGGSITGNTGGSGGVRVSGGTFNVSGGATITGNTDENGAPCNVYLSNRAMNITGVLSGSIGITPDFSTSPAVVAKPGNGYTITTDDLACLSSDGEYDIDLNGANVEIDCRPGISWANVTLVGVALQEGYYVVYNGQKQTPTAVSLTYGGEPLTNGTDYTWEITSEDNLYNGGSAGKNAGHVEITITGIGDYGGKMTYWYWIEQAVLTIEAVTVGDWVYGSASLPEVTGVTFSGLQNGETLELYTDYMATASYNDELEDGNNVEGDVWLTYSQKASNYTLDSDSFSASCNIVPATLTGLVSIEVNTDNGVVGTIGEGDLLAVNIRSNADESLELNYQWYRGTMPIDDATSYDYTLTEHDVSGASITVKVTAVEGGNYTGELTSAPVVVGKKPLGIEVSITGPESDGVLTLNTAGLAEGAEGHYTIQWYRDGAAISGTTSDTYTLVNADLGKYISVIVTGTGDYTGTLVGDNMYIAPTAPDAPDVTATPGNGQVALSWPTPFDGGSPITMYALLVVEGSFNLPELEQRAANPSLISTHYIAPTATSFTVTGLTNGTLYTFVLLAANNEAPSAPAIVEATPKASSVIVTPTTPTLPAADGAAQVDYTQSGGEVTLTLPDSKITEIIGKSDDTAVLDLSGIKDATTATLPTAALGAFSEAGLDVEIKLPQGAITLSGEAAASVAEQASGASISVELGQVPTSTLTEAQREAVKDGDTVLDISILSGTQNISTFDGELTITVPYTGELPVAVWYLNDAGELEKLSCTYDPATGTVNFTLNHLSLYVVGLDTDTPAWANPFTDVKESDWFYADVEYANKNGLMTGTSDTAFEPQTAVSRAMTVTVLWRMEGEPKASGENPFTDVPDGEWYTEAVIWAAENGIVNGVGNNRFAPDDNITREQLAVMLHRYCEYKDIDVSASADLSGYTDSGSISDWAQTAMKWANAEGLITGRSATSLAPKGTATRAELAALLHRFCENVIK